MPRAPRDRGFPGRNRRGTASPGKVRRAAARSSARRVPAPPPFPADRRRGRRARRSQPGRRGRGDFPREIRRSGNHSTVAGPLEGRVRGSLADLPEGIGPRAEERSAGGRAKSRRAEERPISRLEIGRRAEERPTVTREISRIPGTREISRGKSVMYRRFGPRNRGHRRVTPGIRPRSGAATSIRRNGAGRRCKKARRSGRRPISSVEGPEGVPRSFSRGSALKKSAGPPLGAGRPAG